MVKVGPLLCSTFRVGSETGTLQSATLEARSKILDAMAAVMVMIEGDGKRVSWCFDTVRWSASSCEITCLSGSSSRSAAPSVVCRGWLAAESQPKCLRAHTLPFFRFLLVTHLRRANIFREKKNTQVLLPLNPLAPLARRALHSATLRSHSGGEGKGRTTLNPFLPYAFARRTNRSRESPQNAEELGFR